MKFERVLHIYSVYSLFHNTFRQFVSVTIGVTGSQTVSLFSTGVPLSGAPFYTPRLGSACMDLSHSSAEASYAISSKKSFQDPLASSVYYSSSWFRTRPQSISSRSISTPRRETDQF